MVSDTVNTILSAEKQAEEKLKFTRKEAEQIVAEAKDEAELMKEKAKVDAEKSAVTLKLEYKGILKEIVDKNEKLFQDSIYEINSESKKKIPIAVDLVIAKLIS